VKFLDWLQRTDGSPYLVAEVGVAHEGRPARAHQLIQLAASGGADAVKLQAFKADRLVAAGAPIYFRNGQHDETQRQFFRRYDAFSAADYRRCADWAAQAKLDFLCTPFDHLFADVLRHLVPAWKVASADLTNWPLIDYLAQDRKPMLLSTGAATEAEIAAAYARIAAAGCPVVLLHCVLCYPTQPHDAQLGMIPRLAQLFPGTRIGYSDHTLPTPKMEVCTLAYALGAQLIEKHFTDDRRLPGNDHYHSMEVRECFELRQRIELTRRYLGGGTRQDDCFMCEYPARRHARRSWHAARTLPVGHTLKLGDVIPKRPGNGISPIVEVVGRRLVQPLQPDEMLTPGHLA
jgi:N-acetylneuraminate synthase